MSPPLPAKLQREVMEGGLVVGGQYFPSGIRVSSATYCLHYNEEIYPDPFNFRPERRITDEGGEIGSSKDAVALARSGFSAFSAGPRG